MYLLVDNAGPALDAEGVRHIMLITVATNPFRVYTSHHLLDPRVAKAQPWAGISEHLRCKPFAAATGDSVCLLDHVTRTNHFAVGYTANVGPGTVSVLDLKARKTISVISVAQKIQRVSLSLDDKMVFTADQQKPQLAVIDTSSNKIKTWVSLPGPGYGSAPTLDRRWLVVAVPTANKVAWTSHFLKVAHVIDVPSAPQFVLVRPDNLVAYVSCDASHQVAVINLSTWKVDKLIDAGKGADGLAWAAASK